MYTVDIYFNSNTNSKFKQGPELFHIWTCIDRLLRIKFKQIKIFLILNVDSFKNVRNIMELDTVVSYVKITPTLLNKIEDILRVNYYHIGVFLDFDCPFSNIILEKVL